MSPRTIFCKPVPMAPIINAPGRNSDLLKATDFHKLVSNVDVKWKQEEQIWQGGLAKCGEITRTGNTEQSVGKCGEAAVTLIKKLKIKKILSLCT